MIGRALCPILVGREEELSDLEDSLLSALRGEGGVAVLGGEAGLGKSRLAQELVWRAGRLGCEVMSGACSQADLALPYLPFIEAVGNRLAAADVELLKKELGPAAVELGRLFPQLSSGPAPPEADATQAKSRLFEAMVSVLRAVAADHGLLLIVEDVHWADPSTRELLDYMTRRLRGANTLVLATYRTDELHRKHPLAPLLQSWRRSGQVSTIELKPLSPEAVGQVISAIFDGEEVGPEFRDFMHDRTDGNPFVIEEMLKAALDRGDIYRTDSGWDRKAVKDLRLPQTVRDTILLRLERLQPDHAEVLRAASVLGQSFTYQLLVSLTGLDAMAVLAGLDACVQQQLLEEEGSAATYRFRHALTREVIYEGMLTPVRQQLHSRAADALRAAGAPSIDVAGHLVAAGRTDEAVPVCLAAAEEAMATEAHRDAAELYERALAYMTNQAERARLACRLGQALIYSGETTRGRQYLEEGLSTLPQGIEVHEVANYRLGLGRALWETNQPEDSRREYEAARDSLLDQPPSRELAIAYVRLSGIHTFNQRDKEANSTANEAVRIAEALGAEDVKAWALNFLGLSLIGQGHEDEGFDYLDRSYHDAMAGGFPFYAANACYNDVWTRVHLLRTEAIEDRVRRFKSLPPTAANDYARAYIESLSRLQLGEVEHAAALARRGLELAQDSGHAKMTWRISVQLAEVLLEQDRLDEAEALLPAIETRVETQDVTYDGLARARLLLERGSEAELREFGRLTLEVADLVAYLSRALLAAVETEVRVGDLQSAHRILESARARPATWPKAYVLHARGLVALAEGDLVEARTLAGRAVAGYGTARARLDEVRALLLLAETEATGDDLEASTATLWRAWEIAAECGAALLARKTRELASRLSIEFEPAMTAPASTRRPEPLVGEKMVSVLFVDVRGYASMTREKTPAEMVDRIGSLQRWARQETERRGGMVDQFGGDAVMATFNVAGATVDHALDALQAAVAIRDKASLMGLPIGAGIAVGPAVVGRLTEVANVSVLGDTPNLASRLQALAADGEILVSEEAYRRVRAWVESKPMTAEAVSLELKGFDSTVRAYRVRRRAQDR
jgi:class 3 adenylate cyclase